jgi:hypothetical protein
MSSPEPEQFSNSKHPKYFTMEKTPSRETLYLDSEVAREQRNQSEAEVKANADQDGHEGVLAGMKHQIDSMASGSSIAEFGNSVSAVAQDSAGVVKETVMEGVPEALHTVQDQIRALAGGAKEVEETVSDSEFFRDRYATRLFANGCCRSQRGVAGTIQTHR